MSENNLQGGEVLKKHSSAIYTRGSISLLERKLNNILLWHAYDDLLEKTTHEVNVTTLAELSGFNSNNTQALKKSLINLMTTHVEWDLLGEDGSEEWKASTLLSSVGVSKGVCTYQYSDALAKKLSNPELFGLVSLAIQKNFTSGYALTIYEICCRYKGLLKKKPSCSTPWYPLEKFKVLLGVENADYCKEFKYLNLKVIKPSIDEINGVSDKYPGTDIKITMEVKKKGRKISELRFVIVRGKKTSIPLELDQHDDIRKKPLYKTLKEHGLSDKAAIHVLLENKEEFIKEKIEITERASKNGKINSSIAGFLKAAIESDFQKTKTETDMQKTEREEKEAIEKHKLALEKEQQEEEELAKLARAQVREKYIESLSGTEKAELLEKLKTKYNDVRHLIKSLTSGIVAQDLNDLIEDFENKYQLVRFTWEQEETNIMRHESGYYDS